MIPIQVPSGPVKLFHRHGGQHVFASRHAALAALGKRFLREEVGPAFPAFKPYDPFRDPQRYEWRMEGPGGRALVFEDFQEVIPATNPSAYRRYGFYSGSGPVPRAGKRKAGGRSFRAPGTQQERRDAAFWDTEAGEPRPRAKRSSSILPSAWDDHRIAADEDRGWKRHRRAQHRGCA